MPQIDAAINPGNSGGPAFANLASSEVVGVAFSRHKQAEATGYIIPYVVVQHFLESYARRGLFSGLCCLGMLVNRLENPSLRRFHKVPIFQQIVLINVEYAPTLPQKVSHGEKLPEPSIRFHEVFSDHACAAMQFVAQYGLDTPKIRLQHPTNTSACYNHFSGVPATEASHGMVQLGKEQSELGITTVSYI